MNPTPSSVGQLPIHEAACPVPAAPIAAAADLVERAVRPVVVAGSRAVLARADRPLREVAERLGAAVVTSACAKGLFPEAPFHPLGRGVLGAGGNIAALAAVADADLLITVGEPLGPLTTAGASRLLGGKPLVALDVDRAAIGRHHQARIRVDSDARAALEALNVALRGRRFAGADWRRTSTPARPPTSIGDLLARAGECPLDARTVMALLTQLVPQDAHVFTELGSTAMLWSARELRRALPYRYHLLTKIGALPPTAHEALASPERVYLLGDRARGSAGGEVPSAIRACSIYTAIILADRGAAVPPRARDSRVWAPRTAAQLVQAVRDAARSKEPAIIEVAT